MSTIKGKEIPYNCVNDCDQLGCPGHTLRMDLFCTADVINVYIDGKLSWCLDENQWRAMKKSWEGE